MSVRAPRTLASRSSREHWAEHWRQDEYRRPVVHPEIITALGRGVGDTRGKRILEVGAGMGGDSIALAARGAEAYVVDYVRRALRAVAEFAGADHVQVRGVQADALALPFAANSFDAVFHQGLLEHFGREEQVRLLRENWRVLKRGGILIVDVPQRFSEYTWYKRRLIRRGKWFAGWETEFSPLGLVRLVRRAGFRVHFVYPRGYFGRVARLRLVFAADTSPGLGRWVPRWVRRGYRRLWAWGEHSGMAAYVSWSVGVVASKPGSWRRHSS